MLPSLAQAAVTVPANPTLSELVVAGLIAANAAFNYFRSKSSDRRHESKLDDVVQRLERRLDAYQQTNELALQELRHWVVGVDGTNGLRGEVRAVEGRMDDYDKRERERLERKAYDRRSAT